MEEFYPTLLLQRPFISSQSVVTGDVQVRIAYSRGKEDREQSSREEDWKCDVVRANMQHSCCC